MTNFLIGYPDIPLAATTITKSHTEDSSYPQVNTITGGRGAYHQLATATTDDTYVEYDLGAASTKSAAYLAIQRAKLTRKANATRVRLTGSSASYNTPADIAGCMLWLDATRGVTTSSGAVSQWDDQSGQGNNATQGTAANRPFQTRTDNSGNLKLESRTPATSPWAALTCAATNNYAVNYDGTTTAARVLASATGGARQWLAQSSSTLYTNLAQAGAVYNLDFYLKYTNKTYLWVGDEGDAAWHGCNVNIQAGTIQTTTNLTSSSITSLGSGWYKVSISYTQTSSGNNRCCIYFSESGATTGTSGASFTAAGTEEYLFGGVSSRESWWDSTEIVTTTLPAFAGINGNRALAFVSGSSHYLTANAAAPVFTGNDTPFTLFAAIRKSSAPANHAIFSFGNSGSASSYQQVFTSTTNYTSARNDVTTGTTSVVGGTPDSSTHIVSLVFAGTTTSMWIDGVNIANAGAQNNLSITIDRVAIGALIRSTVANFFNGYIGEIIAFNSALGTTDRQSNEEYLAAKWTRTPQVSDTAFDTATLRGPRSEDYISAFSASTAYRYWWLQYGASAASKYPRSKDYFGSWFDFGREPIYPAEQSRTGERWQREAAYEFTLTWVGISNTLAASFNDLIVKYKDISPVVLYDAGDYVLNGHRTLHAWVRDVTITPDAFNQNTIRVVFEEAL